VPVLVPKSNADRFGTSVAVPIAHVDSVDDAGHAPWLESVIAAADDFVDFPR